MGNVMIRLHVCAIAALSMAALLVAPAPAANWDGGNGIWSTTVGKWDGGNVWTQGSSAVFGSPTGIVTLGENISASTITFNVANGHTIDLSGFNLTLTGGTSGHNSHTITNTSATPSTLTLTTIGGGGPTMAGNLNVTKEGAANWTPSTPHSFTGLLTLKGGTTTVSSNNLLGGASATLRMEGTAQLTFSPSASAATFTRNIELVGTSTALQPNDKIITLDGNISGTGALRRVGTQGTLILAGNNSYSGDTTLTNAGSTLIVASANALGSTPTITTSSGNTIGFQGGINVAATPIVTLGSAGTAGKGSLHNFSGDNTFAGEIRLTAASTFGSDSGTLRLTGVIPGDPLPGSAYGSGSRHITKIGPGTVEIANGLNSYRGETRVRSGTLLIGANAPNGTGTGFPLGALGNTTSTVQVGDATVANVTDDIALLINGPLAIGRNIAVNNTNPSATTRLGGVNTSGTSAFTGNIALNRSVVLTSAIGGQVDFTTGVMSGAQSVTVDGGGTVRLASANTFGGAGNNVTVTGGTMLQVANNGNLGNASNALVLNNGILKFEGVFDPSTARTMSVGPSGVGFHTNGLNVAFGNAIGATTGGITKLGPGTLTLSSANAHSGATTVAGGTLALAAGGTINNSPSIDVGLGSMFDVSAQGSYAVLGTQMLEGEGTIVGDVLTDTGSNVSPGNSIGTLTFQDDLHLNGVLSIELDSLSQTDKIVVGGVLDIADATLQFSEVTPIVPGDEPFIFAEYGSLGGGAFASVVGQPAGLTIDYNFNGMNQIALVLPQVQAVPEPAACAAWSLIALLASAQVVFARRRKRIAR
jgi:autotransporter-associated beta strand protein